MSGSSAGVWLELGRDGGREDEFAAICCLGGFVRNDRSHRLGCQRTRRLRSAPHREDRNAERGQPDRIRGGGTTATTRNGRGQPAGICAGGSTASNRNGRRQPGSIRAGG